MSTEQWTKVRDDVPQANGKSEQDVKKSVMEGLTLLFRIEDGLGALCAGKKAINMIYFRLLVERIRQHHTDKQKLVVGTA